MYMEKEEKIVVILLAMVFLSLSIAYVFFFSGASPDATEFSGSSVIGERVLLEGSIISKRFTYTGDHLLLTVDSGSEDVSVFIPSANGAKDVGSRVNEDDTVRLLGIVNEYNGEIEVVVQDEKDVNIIATTR
ncbi:nucleotide-binding protein [Methanolobus halotolerans]|uniref:Nucleotide-binding protein n=2 Tax=Methanolobus halotolerans TaxID=2052935 RepID=A0A4E0Q898_9EURY|nr:nucleotide-binding protein [Methanolobus halotolerans]